MPEITEPDAVVDDVPDDAEGHVMRGPLKDPTAPKAQVDEDDKSGDDDQS